jgi:hypothetical protein
MFFMNIKVIIINYIKTVIIIINIKTIIIINIEIINSSWLIIKSLQRGSSCTINNSTQANAHLYSS